MWPVWCLSVHLTPPPRLGFVYSFSARPASQSAVSNSGDVLCVRAPAVAGAVVGGVIGGLLGVALIVVGAIVIYRRCV